MLRQITITIKNMDSSVQAEVIGSAAKRLAIQGWNMNAGKVTLDLNTDETRTS